MKSAGLVSFACAAWFALIAAPAAYAAPAETAAAKTSGATDAAITQILQRLGQAHKINGVAISPDGKHLAWSRSMDGDDRVQLAAFDGSHLRSVSLAAAHKGCDEGRPSWAPDSQRIAFLSNCGNGKDSAQKDIFLVDTSANKPRVKRLTHLDGYAHALTWAPGGKHLSILYVVGDSHRGGATSATKARVGVIGVHGVQHQRVFTVDLHSGAASALTPASLYVYQYRWSPDAARLAYIAAPPPGENNWWIAQLYTQHARSSAAPKSIVDPNTIKGSLHGLQIALPRWSPDGSKIALIGGLMSDQGSTGGDIYVVPSNGGDVVNATPGIGITPAWLTWTGNNRLLVSSFAGGSSRVSMFTLKDGVGKEAKVLFSAAASFSDGSASSALSLSADYRHFAYVQSDFAHANEVFVGALSPDAIGQPAALATAAHAVTNINATLKPLWGKALSMHWTNEGKHVQGWLLYPAEYDAHKSYPMIVYVHGGPSSAVRPRWPGDGYGPAPLSALGYFVLMPNPRGSFGQGEAYAQAVRKDMGYGDLRDILAGVDSVDKHYPVDDKRLGLTGWSYGGFMSMFAPTQTQRFRAVVAGAGLSNWQSYYGENSIDQWMIPFFGASAYDDPAVYAKSSAINFIKQSKAPTLIIVGQRDAETPAPQSFEFWHALKAMGVPTQLVVYAGQGHHFDNDKDRRDVLERALAWFQKYLPPDPGG